MPRTEYRKKRANQFCGECGYELARDHHGICPMCPRLEQVRLELTAPTPGEMAAHRAARDTSVSAASNDRPPTAAEYRAILAQRQVGSRTPDQSGGRVIRTPVLRQTRVSRSRGGADAADDEVLAPPASPQPPRTEPSSPSPKKAKGRKGKDGGARAPKISEAPPKDLETQSLVAVAAASTPPPRQWARPRTQAAPVGRHVGSRSQARATQRWLIPVAVIAASALIGTAIPILLSWL